MAPLPLPPLTLRLAVTGRRRTPDNAVIREALASVFGAAAGALAAAKGQVGHLHHPETSPMLALVSALAQGADQIATEAFLELPLPAGVARRLEAVLPFGPEDYAGTMLLDDGSADEAAADRMRRLMAQAERRLILADRPRRAQPMNARASAEERRFVDNRYALGGDLLVRQADLLIALWDDIPNNDIGGTASVISQALRDGVPVLVIDIETGSLTLRTSQAPVGDVLTRHAIALIDGDLQAHLEKLLAPVFRPPSLSVEISGRIEPPDAMRSFFSLGGEGVESAPAAVAGLDCKLYTGLLWITGAEKPHKEASSLEIRDWLDHEAERHGDAQRGGGAKHWAPSACVSRHRFPAKPLNCDYVRRAVASGKIRAGVGLPLAQTIGAPWGFADAAATRLGHLYRSVYVGLFGIGALAVFIAVLGLLMNKSYKPWFVGVELAILGFGLAIYILTRRRDIHSRYLGARRISEELRPAWLVARLGLGGRRALAEDATWRAWATQGWIGNVGLPDLQLDRAALATIAGEINADIVQDQLGYHKSNAIKLGLLHEQLEKWGYRTIIISIAISLFYVVFAGFGHLKEPVLDWAVALAGAFLPAVAAGLAGIRFQGDFRRFAERSAQSALELERLGQALADFAARMAEPKSASEDGFASLRVLLLDLERVLLKDLDDWHFVYRARPTPEVG